MKLKGAREVEHVEQVFPAIIYTVELGTRTWLVAIAFSYTQTHFARVQAAQHDNKSYKYSTQFTLTPQHTLIHIP